MEPKQFDVRGSLQLRARMRSGDVRISETDAATATVHVTGERDADEISIEFGTSVSGDAKLTIVQRKEGWGFRSRGVHVEIAAPRGCDVDVATGAGDVTTEGTLAALRIQSGSGDCTIDRVAGPARLRNASGDVRIRSVEGELAVTTASGDVEIDCTGASLEVRTASGDIGVSATNGPARAMSASGDVSIGSAGADLSLRSVSGDIEVGVPAGTRVWFDVSSASGDTTSDLDPSDDLDEAGASFEIKASSVSGDIRIRRAPARGTTAACRRRATRVP